MRTTQVSTLHLRPVRRLRPTALSPYRPRSGFTLIELLVALLVASLVTLLAHEVFRTVTDGAEALEATYTASDRERNAHRWLSAVLLSLEVGQEGAEPFEGTPERMRFTTWLMTPRGWLERRSVTLAAADRRLIATLGTGERIVLADSLTTAAFDYLVELGADAPWVSNWSSPVSAPLAVRVRLVRPSADTGTVDADTLLYLIKGRG